MLLQEIEVALRRSSAGRTIAFVGWASGRYYDTVVGNRVTLVGRRSERPVAVMSTRLAEKLWGPGWRRGVSMTMTNLAARGEVMELALDEHKILILTCRGKEVGAVVFGEYLLEQLNALNK